MIPVTLPDGRVVNINTNDPEKAKIGAAKYYNKTRKVAATELEASEVSYVGDAFRGIGAGAVSIAEGLATLPWEAYDAVVANGGSHDEAMEAQYSVWDQAQPEINELKR